MYIQKLSNYPYIIDIIESYIDNSCWKIIFNTKIIPLLDKGFRLTSYSYYYKRKCIYCYNNNNRTCNNFLCNGILDNWMSREEYNKITKYTISDCEYWKNT